MAHLARLENERDRMIEYLDKHDGNVWRYRYFTRPILKFMTKKPMTRREYDLYERRRWDSD